MKLATPAKLKQLTGKDAPAEQYAILTKELGIRPIFTDGKIRVYEEVLFSAMLNENKQPKKPDMNI
jgi:hypothetical protein